MGTSIPASENPILAQMRRFSAANGKQLPVAGLQWRYYHLGGDRPWSGSPVAYVGSGSAGFVQHWTGRLRPRLAAIGVSGHRLGATTTRAAGEAAAAGGLAKVLTTDPKHTAAIFDPPQYVHWLRQALA
jgi:hypothetical protein